VGWRGERRILLAIRKFLGLERDETAPDHATISRTRRLIDLETHQRVFAWVLERLAKGGLLVGKTIGVDATTLEANAAMKSIVRRGYGGEFLKGLAKASGMKTPTREALARLDRRRKNKASNDDWTSPSDPDAKITKMKDGRTHLAHKAEHAVDMDTGAIVAVTVQGADQGDTSTIGKTLEEADEQIDAVSEKAEQGDVHLEGLSEVVATRVITAIGCCSTSKVGPFVRTCRSRTGDAVTGRTTSMLSKRCTRIAVASVLSEQAATPDARRADRTSLRAPVRDRQHETHPPPWAYEHLETSADSRGRLQPGPGDADGVRCGDPARPPGDPAGSSWPPDRLYERGGKALG
jgi:hypothetical protein